jgi:hypothetical protein
MNKNQHVQAIPFEVLMQAQTKAGELKTLFAPYMRALTPGGKRKPGASESETVTENR